jgi:hypothetical protein
MAEIHARGAFVVNSAAVPARKRANPIAILIRVVVVTVAFGVLGLAFGGLLGIIAISVINLAGETTDMSMALFAGAMPGAVIGVLVGLVVIVRSEHRALSNTETR